MNRRMPAGGCTPTIGRSQPGWRSSSAGGSSPSCSRRCGPYRSASASSSSSARCLTPSSIAAQSAGSMSSGSTSSDHGRLATPPSPKTLCVTPSRRMRCATWPTRRSRSSATSCPAGSGGSASAKRSQAGRSAPSAPRNSSHTPGSAGSARAASVRSAASAGAIAGSKGSGLCEGTGRKAQVIGCSGRQGFGGRRRSMVNGNSRLGSAGDTSIVPGVWPKRKKRARRRLSASNAFTGKLS